MERTILSVLRPPKWTFTMSQKVYKATETTISRADDIYFQYDPKENCIKNIIDTVSLLRSLAFTVHAKNHNFYQTKSLIF